MSRNLAKRRTGGRNIADRSALELKEKEAKQMKLRKALAEKEVRRPDTVPLRHFLHSFHRLRCTDCGTPPHSPNQCQFQANAKRRQLNDFMGSAVGVCLAVTPLSMP